MKQTEMVDLIAVVRCFTPQTPVVAGMDLAWYLILGDLTFAECRDAVVAHFRANQGPWINPGEIRARIATDQGLMSPSEAEAWLLASKYGRQEARLSDLPSPVGIAAQQVADVLRGDAPEGVRHAAFRDAYRPVAARHDDRVLNSSTDVWPAIASATRGRLALVRAQEGA
jgi:hypothetical protein